MSPSLKKRLRSIERRSDNLSARKMETSATTPDERSLFATLTADTVRLLQAKRPLRITVPAYESFTTDATADNTETFTLGHSIADAPNGTSLRLWAHDGTDATLVQPDAVDYAADTFDYSDGGTESTLHAYYVSDESATLELEKATPKGQNATTLYTGNLSLVHAAEQSKRDSAEYLSLSHPLDPWVAQDQEVRVYVNAPYTVRYTDADGHGTTATNLLLNIPSMKGETSVEGLAPAVRRAMAE